MKRTSLRSRSRLANIALVLVSFLASLLILEYTIRWLYGDRINLFPRNHAAARYGEYVIRRLTPNISFWHESIDGRWHFKTNKQGFRADHDYEYTKPAGVFRVLVLGDSHTEGFEVRQDEMFTATLERLLRRRGISAEVLNTGISGFGTAEELVFLENEGLRYQPDVVVIAFYSNDFSDSVRSRLFTLADGRLVEANKVYAPAVNAIWWTQQIPGLKWLGENSYAYSLLFNSVWELMKSKAASEATREYVVKVDPVSRSGADLMAALLQRMVSVAQRNDIDIILADIPSPASAGYTSSIEPELRARIPAGFTAVLWAEEYLSRLPQGQAIHVPHGDRHINANSHRLLAEALDKIVTPLASRRTSTLDSMNSR